MTLWATTDNENVGVGAHGRAPLRVEVAAPYFQKNRGM